MDCAQAIAMPSGIQMTINTVLVNDFFLTSLLVLGSFIASVLLLKKADQNAPLLLFKEQFGIVKNYRNCLMIIALATLIVSALIEVHVQFTTRSLPYDLKIMCMHAISAFVLFATYFYEKKWNHAGIKVFVWITSLVVLVAGCCMLNWNIQSLRASTIPRGLKGMFALHYINFIGTIGMLYLQRCFIQKQYSSNSSIRKLSIWGFTAIFIYLLCYELTNSMVLLFSNSSETIASMVYDTQKAGFPMIWVMR